MELEIVTSVPLNAPHGTELRLNFTFLIGGVEVTVPENYTWITNNVTYRSLSTSFLEFEVQYPAGIIGVFPFRVS